MKRYLGVFILTLSLMFCCSGCGWFNETTKIVKVTKTETKRSGSVSDKYMVFTNKGVFVNTDSYIKWKLNSSDVQNILTQAEKSGDSVKITYYWIRNNFFSMYQNILKAEMVNKSDLKK